MIKCFIGIDPGLSGGVAAIYHDNVKRKSITIDMPINSAREIDVSELKSFFEELECVFDVFSDQIYITLEAQQPFSEQGVKSTFTNGANYGRICAILDVCDFRYERVHPQKWKRMFSLNKDKKRSVAVAERLFPSQKGKFTIIGPRGGVTLRDGAAEALLMAEYGRRVYSK